MVVKTGCNFTLYVFLNRWVICLANFLDGSPIYGIVKFTFLITSRSSSTVGVQSLDCLSKNFRKALSKKLSLKFLPKLNFIEDKSFEYAEKIERLIKENKKNETDKKRYN